MSAFFYACVNSPCVVFTKKRWEPCSKHDCSCVRTMCVALAGQCSVQCRREQRQLRPGQTQNPGNPCVFRSPGPYLMSLSKKKVVLSRVFLSHCLPLTLLFRSFSHASPSSSSRPLEPLCEWMDSKCLLSNSAWPSIFRRISCFTGKEDADPPESTRWHLTGTSRIRECMSFCGVVHAGNCDLFIKFSY